MKKTVFYISLMGVLLITIILNGCNNKQLTDGKGPDAGQSTEVTATDKQVSEDYNLITDMAGRTVEVPREINKVITLCGCAHRFLVYLEASEMIAGVRESEKRIPLRMPWNIAIASEIENIPVISAEDAETISAVNPDFMFATQNADGFDFFEHEDLSQKTNVPLVISRVYTSFSANKSKFDETVRLLAKLIDREARAEELINNVDNIINDLNNRTKDIPDDEKPTVYVGGKAWGGSHGIISTSARYSAFDFLSAVNVASGVGEENAFIDKEALLMWDPDIIFIEYSGFEQTLEDLKSPEFSTLKAVKNNNVYKIFPKIWCNTNYENVLVNAYYIGSVIYPEQFSDIDIAKKANEIYEIFLGTPIYDEMIEVYGEFSRVDIN